MIRFQIPNSTRPSARLRGRCSPKSEVLLRIYDVSGRLVRDFSRLVVNGERSTVVWDGCDEMGRKVPAGIYFIRLEAGEFRKVEKAILLR